MKCTIDEQETCDVEKRGCEGCYYDDKGERMMDILQSFVDIAEAAIKNGEYEDLKGDVEATKWAIETIQSLKNKVQELEQQKACLHCGSGEAAYCEECYQKLIAENAKLQRGIKQC